MRAAGYVRVSTDEQAREGCSLDNQEARIRAYCDSQEWDLIHILREEGYSGKTTDRPALQLLLGSVRDSADVQVVLVYKLDRLSRNQRDVLNILHELESHNVLFKSVTESFDTTTPGGRAFMGMLGVFNQLERDTIAERTKDALAHKKANGEPVGTPGYGWKVENGVWIEDEAEQAVLCKIREWYELGASYGWIADKLNSERIPCKHGGAKWHASTVRSVLNAKR